MAAFVWWSFSCDFLFGRVLLGLLSDVVSSAFFLERLVFGVA